MRVTVNGNDVAAFQRKRDSISTYATEGINHYTTSSSTILLRVEYRGNAICDMCCDGFRSDAEPTFWKQRHNKQQMNRESGIIIEEGNAEHMDRKGKW